MDKRKANHVARWITLPASMACAIGALRLAAVEHWYDAALAGQVVCMFLAAMYGALAEQAKQGGGDG